MKIFMVVNRPPNEFVAVAKLRKQGQIFNQYDSFNTNARFLEPRVSGR